MLKALNALRQKHHHHRRFPIFPKKSNTICQQLKMSVTLPLYNNKQNYVWVFQPQNQVHYICYLTRNQWRFKNCKEIIVQGDDLITGHKIVESK